MRLVHARAAARDAAAEVAQWKALAEQRQRRIDELENSAPPSEGDGRGLTGAAVRAHADRGVIDGPSLLARVLMYAAKGEPPSRGLLADIEAFFDTADAPGEWWVFSDPESDAAKYTAPTAFDAAEKWLADNINADAYDGTEVEAWPLASVKRFVVKQTNEEWSNDVPGARETYEIVPAPSAPVETGDGARDGVALIAAERRRQVEQEGWTPEHDDRHDGGELAEAAACYAAPWFPPRPRDEGAPPIAPEGWPWGARWWKPGDRVRELTKAGALIAAEIDRLQRFVPSPVDGAREEGA